MFNQEIQRLEKRYPQITDHSLPNGKEWVAASALAARLAEKRHHTPSVGSLAKLAKQHGVNRNALACCLSMNGISLVRSTIDGNYYPCLSHGVSND
ncbi:TPA: hypothetical protein ACIUKL_002075 [Salmonella enterica subsp. enterica serovar 4,5,12:b:-]|uniref:Uncharacterized protein n=3 Tax=Salmonella enterica I TaxID=59201 RepID=A0A738YS97_SALET|nr:hypothetical protein [Salmonella enterica subsp. enterica]EAP3270661.1 hypothetical protein [Salmonella enterica]ECF4502127.1 hypothetical protein [Salmonella enterica subsp. enterica serovar Javiana]EGI6247632.1 hypothetical protein [Salmonella enterica subsp. enterica serovar Orientalis]EKQ9749706.1 hypothetical protein [Salmonella enterica subsp. enterica serovar 4,[5],12:b:-]QVP99597.1 hypothetical protein CAI54_21960 [Salmonella enterica subsp. enterica serovar Paratyphi B str. CFSAN00